MENQETMAPQVRSEFLVERQGKQFVLYAGLLDLAHSQGLRRIETEVVQLPSSANEQTAVVRAEVETTRGTFSGIGDASPLNVSRAMLTCTIRLAETRAKARALRDAVNVGVVALEEVGEDNEAVQAAAAPLPFQHRQTVDEPTSHSQQRHTHGGAPEEPATEAQLRAIYATGKAIGKSKEDIEDFATTVFGRDLELLTKREASQMITQFKTEQGAN